MKNYWPTALFALTAGMLGGNILNLNPVHGAPQQLIVRSIVVVDEAGTPRIRLSVEKDKPQLQLFASLKYWRSVLPNATVKDVLDGPKVTVSTDEITIWDTHGNNANLNPIMLQLVSPQTSATLMPELLDVDKHQIYGRDPRQKR